MYRVIELFAGIGSQTQALKNIKIEHTVEAISEINKFSIISYAMLHGAPNNLGNISTIFRLPESDLWTYSFPCQDISLAGKLAGISQGTRSGLLLEVGRLLKKAKECGTLPNYLLLENVKNLIGKKFIGDFYTWLEFLYNLGYDSYYRVLNSKDYGIPQDRARVFCISLLRSKVNSYYRFPKKRKLLIRLKDLLEKEVPEKYYISDKTLQNKFICRRQIHEPMLLTDDNEVSHTLVAANTLNYYQQYYTDINTAKIIRAGMIDEGKYSHSNRVYDSQGLAPCLTTMQGGGQEPKIVAMRGRNPDCPSDRSAGKSTHQRIEESREPVTHTITSVQKDNLVKEANAQKIRIRRLTPREVWRLMGWKDPEIDLVKSKVSDSQMYKQGGESIVVQVLEAIFENLFRPVVGHYEYSLSCNGIQLKMLSSVNP